MAERLKILDHHVRRIIDNGICEDGIEKNILKRIKRYIKKNISPEMYAFPGKEQRQKFVKAFKKAAIAVYYGDFEPVPDFVDSKQTARNFDLICDSCPNYKQENQQPDCVLEKEFENIAFKIKSNAAKK